MSKPKRWGGPPQPTNLFDVAPALESEYEDSIVEAALRLGYRVHVERRARTKDGFRTAIKGNAGWPDIVIVGHGRAWFIELKRKPRHPTGEQLAWIAELTAAGLDARVAYVPEEHQTILDDLITWRDSAIKKGTNP